MNPYQHIVNVEGIVKKGGQLLTVIRSDKEDHAAGTLSFIGGKVEFSDRQQMVLETTLKREIQEEVGVEVDRVWYVTSTAFLTDDNQTVVNIVFLCEWQSGEPYAADPDEVASVQWMTADEIRTNPRTPSWILEYTTLVQEFMTHER